MTLNNNHWRLESYSQRMTRAEWQQVLLKSDDRIIMNGRCRQLVAKNLGAGVYEVYKKPLQED